MHFGEILFTLAINSVLVFVLLYFQKRSLEQHIKRLRKEIVELEDLVVAIIEEFEAISETVVSPGEVEENHEVNHNIKFETAFLDDTSHQITESEILHPLHPSSTTFSIKDPRHQNILELWKQGLSIEAIAKKMGTGQGEIKLILGLYHRS